MSTAVMPREIQRAKSVSARVDEISDDVIEQKTEGYCNRLQSLVFDCAALASQWRALVEHISTSDDCGKEIDYRTLRDILGPAASRTSTIYSDVHAMVEDSSFCDVKGFDDVVLAMIEAPNIAKWIESWPTHDSARRDAAREAISRGEFSLADDLIS